MADDAELSSIEPARRGNESLTREDWITGAWEMLGETGLDGVRVEPLAKRLGVTKGSFYWHFKERQELLDALLDRWFAIGKDHLLPAYEADDNAPDRIWSLFESVIQRTTRGQTVTLRLLSHKDPEVARRIEERDAHRLAFLVRELKEIGFPQEEARVRGQIYQAIMTGEFLRSGGLPLTERLTRAREFHLLLSTNLGQ
ncbi:MAG: Tetracycline repressor protein class H [Alphaproteobacteria bacterium MarineAlpha11_Bin1]|nr:MAG: Tetracycline repressor protein class H [Alphaproteobacteria bacterium MarineAlpha11_Bin1]|tara:strand:+ start:5201 stop:5797 length:597 start_codon:yes stop_codon:yes gene_type:complete